MTHPLHWLNVKDGHGHLGGIHWLPNMAVAKTIILELTIIGEEGRM